MRKRLRPSRWQGLLTLIPTALIPPLLTILCCDVVFGRAGGGGGFGGGGGGGFGGGGGGFGGGGFGGSGGGSGGGDPRAALVIFAIAIVIMLVRLAIEAQQRRVSRTIRRGHQRQAAELRSLILQQIKADDSAFDLNLVVERVESAFLQTQQAWSQQEMRPVRAFISDGIYERFSLQLAMQQAEGLRNIMEDVRVHTVELAAAAATEQFDTLHFRIRASATDYQIRVDSGREVAGTRRDDEFVEFWSFHRRHGAQTQSRGGSIEGQCPQCGSPLQIVDKAQCESCSSWINSGEHDWVLAEITQQSEWRLPGNDATTPGVAELRAVDPHFSVQHIEDRVSVMFWRIRAAEFYQEGGYAAPIIGSGAERLTVRVNETIQRKRYVQEPAVGLVDLIDVQAGEKRDRARVKIRWSGTKHSGDPTGTHRMLHRQAIYTEVYILERNAGVASGSGQTFASSSCPNCAAPLGINREPNCSFCQTPLTDGRHDWVLVDIQPFTAELNNFSDQLQERYERTKPRTMLGAAGHMPHEDRELDLAIIARVLTMDGELTKREVRAFRNLAEREGIAQREADLMLTNREYLDVPLPIPRDGQEAKRQLQQVAYATLIDGRLTRPERKLLSRYASHFELSGADVKLVVQETRARMYREARELQNGNGQE